MAEKVGPKILPHSPANAEPRDPLLKEKGPAPREDLFDPTQSVSAGAPRAIKVPAPGLGLSIEQVHEVVANFNGALVLDPSTRVRSEIAEPSPIKFEELRSEVEEGALRQLLEAPIPALDLFFATHSLVNEGRAFLEARKSYTDLEHALSQLQKTNAKPAAISDAKRKLEQAKAELFEKMRSLGVSSLVNGGEITVRGAEWLGEFLSAHASEHLSVFTEAADAAFFPLRAFELKDSASAIASANSDVKALRVELERLKKEGGDPLLITILDLKVTYQENIAIAQKIAVFIQRLFSTSHGATGVAGLGLKLTALTAAKAIMAKVAWPFTLGAVGLLASYAALFEKSNLANVFAKVPDQINMVYLNLQLKRAPSQREKTDIQNQMTTLTQKMARMDLEAQKAAKSERMGISQEEYDKTRELLAGALDESAEAFAIIESYVQSTGDRALIEAFTHDPADALMDYMFT